jgi:tetratricopeptide (TPR) repeat protein
MKILSKWVWALCLFLTTAAMPLTAAGPKGPAGTVYRKALHGTALVLSAKGQGTGWVVNREQKQLVTCQHVAGAGDKVVVLFPQYRDGRVIVRPDWYAEAGDPIVGRVVRADPQKDLALIQLERLPADVAELKLAEEAPEPGDPVHAVGCPGGSSALWVYSSGTVRDVTEARWQDGPGASHVARVVETQIPLNPGDSGGPLLNNEAELVGVNQGRSRTAQLISQSIAVEEVRQFLKKPGLPGEAKAQATAEESYQRGLDLKSRKEYREAALAFLEAIERDPQHVKAHAELAWVLNELKEYDLALQVCLAGLKLEDTNAEMWREAGYAFLKKGDGEHAEQALKIAVDLNPNDRSALGYYADALDLQGKVAEAKVVRAKRDAVEGGIR